jgi:threonyl-tRNA synthetase
MGKKDKKAEKKDDGVSCNATTKFAVLDYPGVAQPAPVTEKPAVDEAAAAAAAASQSNKDGLQGRRAKASSGPRIETGLSIGKDSFVTRTKNPEWLQQRNTVYDAIKARRTVELDCKIPAPITVTMPDGNVLLQSKDGTAFTSWKTSPYIVAAAISQGLADSAAVARVTYESFAADYDFAQDGMEGEDTLSDAMADGGVEQEVSEQTFLWDMQRPLVGTVKKLEFLKFDTDQDAKTVFWHSSAHMMGEALEHLYGCKLTIGPPLAGGFYYDSYMGKDALREDDCTWCIVIVIVAVWLCVIVYWMPSLTMGLSHNIS